MNSKITILLLSKICFCLGAVMAIPLLMAFYYSEPGAWAFLKAMVAAFAVGAAGTLYSGRPSLKNITVREGIGTVVFAWLLAGIICGLPLYFFGVLGPLDAYFESISGLTTTGATVITDLEVLPKCILFWRSLLHWIGGIGIIVIFVALLPQIGGGAVQLVNAEVSGFTNSRILPRIRTTAIALFYIYSLITIILTGILVMLGMSHFDAINHAFSAIATGGFSTYNSSVTYFDNVPIEIALGIFMILAGGNFALYYQAAQGDIKALYKDEEFRAYLALMAVLVVLITCNIVLCTDKYTWLEGLRHSFFQVASFGTTTGYVSHDYEQWPSFAKMLLAVAYLTGACAGSTAGGIKICRFVVLVKTVLSDIKRSLHPQMLLTVHYGNKSLPIGTIMRISRFFFLYIMVIITLAGINAFAGMDLEEAVFGIGACLSSVGPAFGSIGATGNYAEVPSLGKLAMTVAMVLGRLELFTALALLRSEFWKSDRW